MGNRVKVLSILRRIPYSLRVAILIVLMAKILVLSLAYAVTYVNEGPAPPLTIVMKELTRWDAPHYIEIAKNWYVNQGEYRIFLVFPPLYPILIRLVTVDFSYINLSALVVSNLSSLVALIYLFKLAKLDFDDSVTKKAVLFLCVFPTAYFLSAPYSEGLFFALVIASVYYARLAKWPLAGLLGMLAALTRIAGLLLLPTLLVEYLYQKGWRLRKIDVRKIDTKIFWIGLVLVGFLIYLGINYQVAGNPFMFVYYEQNPPWYQNVDPYQGLSQAYGRVLNGPFPDNITTGAAPIAFAVLGFVAVIGGFMRRLRPSYLVYALLTWMLAVSTAWWISVPRYVMAMFPMFILFGLLSRKRAVTAALTVAFLVGLCFFTVIFALGRWAF